MILGIVGSRFFTDLSFVKRKVNETVNVRTVEKIISGGANGVDTCAKDLAEYYGIPFEEKNAKWRVNGIYDNSAGMKRNIEIINAVDVVIAFWDKRTVGCGTYHDINYCREIGRTCHVIMIGGEYVK